MPATDLNRLSATEIARRIAVGETTAVTVTEACLAHIEERESVLHAWAFIDPNLGRALAGETGTWIMPDGA
jgi:Asp-tRNA(Asn)/Glu-tRNA(Gln) amidotransferase A subunit family amidase